MTGRRAFTMIEILIVVIILGILAATVIQQFGNVSDDAKAAALAKTIQSVRSQVELFKLQAGGNAPSVTGGSQNFWATLMASTTVDGKPCGPWIQAAAVNPFSNGSGVASVADAAAAATGDWCISSGKFYGNSRGTWIPKN